MRSLKDVLDFVVGAGVGIFSGGIVIYLFAFSDPVHSSFLAQFVRETPLTVPEAGYWLLVGMLNGLVAAWHVRRMKYRLASDLIYRLFHATRTVMLLIAFSTPLYILGAILFSAYGVDLIGHGLVSCMVCAYLVTYTYDRREKDILPAVYYDQSRFNDDEEDETAEGIFVIPRQGAPTGIQTKFGDDVVEFPTRRREELGVIQVEKPSDILIERLEDGIGDWSDEGLLEAFQLSLRYTNYRSFTVCWIYAIDDDPEPEFATA